MALKQRLPVLLAIAGFVLYFALFYSAEMSSLTQATGKSFVRAELLQYLLVPEALGEFWLGVPPEFSLADRLPVLLVAAMVLGWAIVLGWVLLVALGIERTLTRLENLVFSAAVGLNAVSTCVLAVGLAGWLHSRAVFALPAAGTLLLAGWLWRKRKAAEGKRGRSPPVAVSSRSGERKPAPEKRSASFVLAGLLPFVAMILLGGMLPPVDFDVREYHLQVPKEFYQQGRIGFLPHNVYGNMPLGTEMLSLLAMVIAGDWWLGALAGKTVIAALAPFTALGLLAAGRRFYSAKAGAVAAVVYLSIPWVIQVSTLGLVDAALGFYLFLAFYAACLAGPLSLWERARVRAVHRPVTPSAKAAGRQAKQRRDKEKETEQETGLPQPGPVPAGEGSPTRFSFLVLAGYLAGGAVSCKYPGVLFVVLPLTLWVLVGFRNAGLPKWRLAWKPAAAFILAAAVGCGLWFGKNWAVAGNPTYPLLYPVFGGKTWTAAKDRQWNAVHRPHDFSLRALGRDAARVGLTSEWLSPLLMPLAVLAFAARPRRLTVGLAVYFGLVVAAWWLLTHRIDRFWVPAMPLAALLAGVGATWCEETLWRRAMAVVLVFGLVANFLTAGSVGGGYNRYFVSLKRLRDDPERVDAWHRYLNRHDDGGQVLLVGDAQPFDLAVPVLYNTCFDDSIFEQLVNGRAPEEVRAVLAERGITRVYVDWAEIHRYRRTYGFTDFVQPAVFDQLVAQGVLAPLPQIPGDSGRGYRVIFR